MSAPRLAPAGPAHAAVMAALHAQCFDDAWSVRAVADVLASPGAFAYLALVPAEGDPAADGAEVPVGFALARRTGDDAELLTLCVLREHRRRRIGAALLEAVTHRARQFGAHSLFLEVAETNQAAQILYAAHGFVAGRRRPDYYRGPNRVPVAALELRRDLAGPRPST